jgi:excisionase family DNA binding protein
MHAYDARHDQPPDQLAELAGMMRHLIDSVDDLRSQIAGTRKELYTVDEVARLTGRTPYTVRRWITEGRVRATRVEGTGPRGRLLIPGAELVRLIRHGLGGDLPPTVADADGQDGGLHR